MLYVVQFDMRVVMENFVVWNEVDKLLKYFWEN